MKERIVTESGSVYIIDYDNKTWTREQGEGAATIRSDSGVFDSIQFPTYHTDSAPSIWMICPPFSMESGAIGREIISTAIVSREIIAESESN